MADRFAAMREKALLTSVPRVVTATTQITAIKPTSMPYSTRAAPSSSRRKLFTNLRIRRSFDVGPMTGFRRLADKRFLPIGESIFGGDTRLKKNLTKLRGICRVAVSAGYWQRGG